MANIPDKIYLREVDLVEVGDFLSENNDKTDIEYIRKDVLIEKTWGWIEDNLLSSNQQDKSRLYYEDFKNYMKGE